MTWRERLRHYRVGRDFGYPLCCVLSYALDPYQHKACRRGVVDLGVRSTKIVVNEGTGHPVPQRACKLWRYVPCRWHKRRHPNWRPIKIPHYLLEKYPPPTRAHDHAR